MYIILKTLISAIIIVAVSEIAKKYTWTAAIIVSLPLTSLLAFVWLYWDTKDSLKAYGNVKLTHDENKRRLLSNELNFFRKDSLTQIIELKKSAEAYNLVPSKTSAESNLMLFENMMKGRLIKAVLKQDTIKSLKYDSMSPVLKSSYAFLVCSLTSIINSLFFHCICHT